MSASSTEPVGEAIFAKTMLVYYRSLNACASAGHHLLADTGFYSRALVTQCVQELAARRVWLVGVHCALPELERREQARADRMPGLARQQCATIHAHTLYDVEVDTSVNTVQACAQQIKAVITSQHLPQVGRALFAAIVADLREQDCPSLLLWTLAANPIRHWYEQLGGAFVTNKQFDIDERPIVEVAYGWPNIDLLSTNLAP